MHKDNLPESDEVKVGDASIPRLYACGLKRSGARSYELTATPRSIPVYDSPERAERAGKQLVEMAGNHSTLIRGPYTNQKLENVEVVAVDITHLVELGIITSEMLFRARNDSSD